MSKDKKEKKIIDFKKYLKKDNPLTGKLYFGNIDHEVDEGFEAAIKLLEKKISKAVDRSVKGQLWTSSGFNYKATVEDVNNAIKLITSQATLDAIGPYSEENERPSAVNFRNTPEGYLEEVDPDQSQRQGVMDTIIPDDVLNLDERFIELARLLSEKK